MLRSLVISGRRCLVLPFSYLSVSLPPGLNNCSSRSISHHSRKLFRRTPFADFKRIVRFSGYSPAHGADEVANYLATEAKSMGLTNVAIERYPSDGKSYYWAFHTEPLWEAQKGELWLVKPRRNCSLTQGVQIPSWAE